ncbi:matrix-remodeling-associated 5 isoform X1, putative [Babesia ovata]|uniref:Matrix-remodeling-associated 5 isoform X1, putative n=1 Tax=Babesia ovata TaxID=189622 RepID=A0A2H6KCH5_9APIC|nr:matrix-remodeling-associated 5 isoform X1, putative [Babesia ovata]GBE60695.1 matrix-remodeling-associated 5 isoform X1, putative [Babesia ovata]
MSDTESVMPEQGAVARRISASTVIGSTFEHVALPPNCSIEMTSPQTSDSNDSIGYNTHSEDEEQTALTSTNAHSPQFLEKDHQPGEPRNCGLLIIDGALAEDDEDEPNDSPLSPVTDPQNHEDELERFVETAARYHIKRSGTSHSKHKELPHSISNTSTESIACFNYVAQQLSGGKGDIGVDIGAKGMGDGSTAGHAVAREQQDGGSPRKRRGAKQKGSTKESTKVRKTHTSSPYGLGQKEKRRNYYSKERVDITLRSLHPLMAMGLPGTKGTFIFTEPDVSLKTMRPHNPVWSDQKADDASSSDQDKGDMNVDVTPAAAKLKGMRGGFRNYGRRRRERNFVGTELSSISHKILEKDLQWEALRRLRFCRLYSPIPTKVLEGNDDVSTDIIMTGSLADYQFDPDCCDVDTSGVEMRDQEGAANTAFISKCHLTYNADGSPCWCCCYIDFFNVLAQKRFDVDVLGCELAQTLAYRCKENAETLFHMSWIQHNRNSLDRCIPTDASISVLQRFVQIKHAVLRVDRMGLFSTQMRQVVKL